MKDPQMKPVLQEIAEESIPSNLDLWPALQAHLQKRQSRSFSGRFLPRLAGAAAALIALALLIVWVSSFSQMTELSATRAPSSDPVPAPDMLAYPKAPATLPLYRLDMTSPTTAQEMLAWAVNFGMPDPKLFRDATDPESLLAVGSDGSRLIFSPAGHPFPSISYKSADLDDIPPGGTFPTAQATAAAEAFLREHGLLPPRYHVRELLASNFMADGSPARLLRVSPDLDGYALYGSEAGGIATLHIDPMGSITFGRFAEARFTEGESVAIRPAQQVVADFTNGRLSPIQMDMAMTPKNKEDVTRYTPPLPIHTIGEQVTILQTDRTDFLIAEDGTEIRAILHTETGAEYVPVTPELAQVAGALEDDVLRVTGTITAEINPGSWKLAVDAWEIVPAAEVASGCLVGNIQIAGDEVWLAADKVTIGEGEPGRYLIPTPPQALETGTRIEVCAKPMTQPGTDLLWTTIFAPPRRIADNRDTQTIRIIEPVGLEQASSPYEIGESVTLTGTVQAELHRTADEAHLQVTLFAELPGSESGRIYSLIGDEALLQEIAYEHFNRYLQITGTVVTAPVTSSESQQAIEVQRITQPWPQQRLETFVGHFIQATKENEQITVFVDNTSGRQYAIDTHRSPFASYNNVRQATAVWVSGVVHPARSLAGLPLLTLFKTAVGEAGAELTVDSFQAERIPPIVMGLPNSSSGSDEAERLVIEKIELAYYFDATHENQLAYPVWVLVGQTRDYQEQFIAYLPATSHQ